MLACLLYPLSASCSVLESSFSRLKNFNFNLISRDLEIARSQKPKNISVLAEEIGIFPEELELYGTKKAKVSLDVVKRLSGRKDGKYIVVAG